MDLEKTKATMQELCRQHAGDAIRTLVDIAKTGTRKARTAALNALACRTYIPGVVEALRQLAQDAIRKAGLSPCAERRRQAGRINSRAWAACLAYWNHRCAICGQSAGLFHSLAADHWIPIADPSCPGSVPWNILPLCHSRPGGFDGCNNLKSRKPPEQWLTEKLGEKAASKLRKIRAYFASVRMVLAAT